MLNLQPITPETPRAKCILLVRVVDTERHPTMPRIGWVKRGKWSADEHGVMAWREEALGAPGPKIGPRLDPTHWALLEELEAAA